MTSEDYREILATRQCPNCRQQFTQEDMGMYGDSYGWKLDDAGFGYTLYAVCSKCSKQFSFKELGIEEIVGPLDPAKVIQFPTQTTPASRVKLALDPTNKMLIRLLERKDIEVAAGIVRINYSEDYEKRALAELQAMFGESPIKPRYFVAEDEGEIVGFAGYIQSWMDYTVYELFWVNVLPAKQRLGIGGELVTTIINEIKKDQNARLILLTAAITERKLPEYYRAFGFKKLMEFNNESYELMVLKLH